MRLSRGNFHKVPYLLGFTSKEAAGWFSLNDLSATPIGMLMAKAIAGFDLDNRGLIPTSMNVESGKQTELGRKIYEKYFNTTPAALSLTKFERVRNV